MSDVMTEDDELEIVEVDEIPESAAEEPAAPEAAAPEAEEPDEDDDEDDERLAESQDDSEDDIVNRNRIKRQKRRQAQKQGRERLEAEVRRLAHENMELARKVNTIEGVHLTQAETTLAQQLDAAREEVRQTEVIIARAVEAGNGEDVAAAMRLRDDAKYRADQVAAEQQRFAQTRQAPTRPVDPRTRAYATQWVQANPWYSQNGADEASVLARRIDQGLLAEGYDPTTEGYYRELTRRVEARFGGPTVSAEEPAPRRNKAPPMGATREHAPTSTRRTTVHVTPEIRQSLEDAGYWDDPVVRNRVLRQIEAQRKNPTR
jgi:hypothetical protein